MKEFINKIKENSKVLCIIILLFLFLYLIILSFFLYSLNKELEIIKSDIKENKIQNELIKNKLLKIEAEKRKKIDFINNLDLKTDNSLTKFVNSSVSFNNKAYVPKNLEKIWSDYVYDSKWWRQVLRKEANEALQKLAEAFYKKFNKKMTVVSAYRSYAYQKWIKDRWCPDNLCSKPGYSEHQSGLAMDFFEATTKSQFLSNPKLVKYFNWLNENANKFGFHNTYQKWLKIDGYAIEPWHWRYMWVELATYLKENNITIAEFYFNKKN